MTADAGGVGEAASTRDTPTGGDLDGAIEAVRASTARLLGTVGRVDEAAARRPSLLPGWTVAHVLTHLARNADGNRRMLEGAGRGQVLEQYAGGVAGRAADIESGARRPAAEIVGDLVAASGLLAEVTDSLPQVAWQRAVRPLRGEMPAWRTLWSRRREVEVHHVDLALGYGPGDWPGDFVARELDTVVSSLAARLPAGTAVRVVEASGRSWEVGDGPASLTVWGPAAWLLTWLVGRPVPTGVLGAPAGLPPLAPW